MWEIVSCDTSEWHCVVCNWHCVPCEKLCPVTLLSDTVSYVQSMWPMTVMLPVSMQSSASCPITTHGEWLSLLHCSPVIHLFHHPTAVLFLCITTFAILTSCGLVNWFTATAAVACSCPSVTLLLWPASVVTCAGVVSLRGSTLWHSWYVSHVTATLMWYLNTSRQYFSCCLRRSQMSTYATFCHFTACNYCQSWSDDDMFVKLFILWSGSCWLSM